MKHITPISKAQDGMSTSEIITLVVGLVTAMVPLIATIVDSSKTKR